MMVAAVLLLVAVVVAAAVAVDRRLEVGVVRVWADLGTY